MCSFVQSVSFTKLAETGVQYSAVTSAIWRYTFWLQRQVEQRFPFALPAVKVSQMLTG